MDNGRNIGSSSFGWVNFVGKTSTLAVGGSSRMGEDFINSWDILGQLRDSGLKARIWKHQNFCHKKYILSRCQQQAIRVRVKIRIIITIRRKYELWGKSDLFGRNVNQNLIFLEEMLIMFNPAQKKGSWDCFMFVEIM